MQLWVVAEEQIISLMDQGPDMLDETFSKNKLILQDNET
jgi:hypothetical protein